VADLVDVPVVVAPVADPVVVADPAADPVVVAVDPEDVAVLGVVASRTVPQHVIAPAQASGSDGASRRL